MKVSAATASLYATGFVSFSRSRKACSSSACTAALPSNGVNVIMQIASADAPSPMTYTVGTVPPSMTYSVPVMDPARGDASNATRSATPCGFAGRPIGMPPSESVSIFLAARNRSLAWRPAR